MPSTPAKRKVADNINISPKKCFSTRRHVDHFSALIGDGSVMFVIPVVNGNKASEPFTHPAKKVIDERVKSTVLDAGFTVTLNIISTGAPDTEGDNALRNARGYQMKLLAAQSDEAIDDEGRIKKMQILTTVSK